FGRGGWTAVGPCCSCVVGPHLASAAFLALARALTLQAKWGFSSPLEPLRQALSRFLFRGRVRATPPLHPSKLFTDTVTLGVDGERARSVLGYGLTSDGGVRCLSPCPLSPTT
ncbi:hypothetical protein B0H13DRAFT_1963711, partial [Mycena leptocephala]